MSVVESALSYLGVPYLYGGTNRNGIDCSALMQNAYRENGITIPRVAQDQYNQSKKIEADELQAGDLIFESSTGSTNNITHVLMYIGDGKAVEAPRTGYNVRVTNLSSRKNIVGYGSYNAASSQNMMIPSDISGTQTGVIADTGKSILSSITMFIFILGLAILGVVFLMKAFNN